MVLRKYDFVPAFLQHGVGDKKAPRRKKERSDGPVLKMPIDLKLRNSYSCSQNFIVSGRARRLPVLSRICSEFDSCSPIILSTSRAILSRLSPLTTIVDQQQHDFRHV